MVKIKFIDGQTRLELVNKAEAFMNTIIRENGTILNTQYTYNVNPISNYCFIITYSTFED